MESALAFMDDLLDFSSDVGEEEEEEEEEDGGNRKALSFNVLQKPKQPNDSCRRLLPEEEDYAEEELEWLSNKDAFPAVETFVDILSEQPRNVSKQHSPVSVLDNTSTSSNSNHSDITNKNNIHVHGNGNGNGSSILMSCCGSLKVPGKARSKRRRKLISTQPLWFKQHPTTNRNPKQILPTATTKTTTTMVVASVTNTIGRKCLHCGAEKTPQWRAGPLGPKTLCNACGVRYKSGRLVPEYRPASSPTFSPQLHSNSHRKVIEMRRQKHLGMLVNPMDKG